MTTAILNESAQRVKKLDPELLLGHLAWYTIHDMRSSTRSMDVSHADVVACLKRAGLKGDAPSAPRGHDVFRRVTSDVQRKKVPVPGQDGVFQNILLRDVNSAGEAQIIRRLVVETVDAKGHKLSYHQLVDLEYHRDSGRITHQYKADYRTDTALADRTVMLVKQTCTDQGDKLTSWTIREFVRKLLYTRGATCVRAGGAVFFLRQEFADELDAIEEFVNILPSGLGEFHSLPLIDDQKQRLMVRKAFEAETIEAIKDTITEIDAIRQDGKKIKAARYSQLLTKKKELKAKTAEYSALLGVQIGTADAALEIFELKMKQLLDNVKE